MPIINNQYKSIRALAISLDTTLLKNKYGNSLRRQRLYARELGIYCLIVLNKKDNLFLKSIDYHNLQIIPTNSLSRLSFIKDALTIAKKEILARNINVITAQDPFLTGLIGVWLKHKYNLPLNIQLHSDFFTNKYWKQKSIQNRLLYPIGVWCLHQADTLRYDNKRKIMKLYKKFPHISKKAFKAPMFVDLSYFSKKPENKSIRNIISVGRLSWEKNYDSLIDVISEIARKDDRVTLTIVGGGPLLSRLTKQILTKGLKSRIKITGFQKQSQVKKLLHKSDLFILNSYYEGWALVIMEALAAGLPVIMTDVGSAEELIINNKTGIIIPRNNPQKLQLAIEDSINNHQQMYKLAKAGQQLLFTKYQKNKLFKAWIGCLHETSKIET